MTSTPKIRKISFQDIKTVEKIALENEPIITQDRRMMYYLFTRLYNKYSFVCEADGQVVGYLICLLDATAKILWIHQIAIDHNFKRQGIAKLLTSKLIHTFNNNSECLEKIHLAVKSDNDVAHAFYAGYEFKHLKYEELIEMDILEYAVRP